MKNRLIRIVILNIIIIFTISLGFFIGIDLSIKTLLLVMAIDYMLGLSLAVVGKSKHGDGRLSSKVGYKGIIKKINMLLLVGLAVISENYLTFIGLHVNYIKGLVTIAFIINEVISIIENSKLTGLDIGDIISRSIDLIKLKNKK